MKKVKILQIIPSMHFGGAEKVVLNICRYIDKEKFDIKVVCLRDIGGFAVELKKIGVPFVFMDFPPKLGIFKVGRLAELIRQERPDIVHTHLFGGDFYGIIAARIAGVNNIVTTEHNLNYAESHLKHWLKKMILSKTSMVVAVSGAVKNYLAQKYGLRPDKVRVIHNRIETENFEIERNYDKGELVVGAIGRLEKQKGFRYLISAMEYVDQKTVRCLIAGDGSEKSSLEKMISRKGLSNRVHLVGKKRDIKEFLSEIDIFVLPSLWEGLGIVLLEAGVSGIPVIASDVDGIREIICHYKNGILVPSRDPRALAEKISELIVNRRLRQDLGQALRRKVKSDFSVNMMIDEYEHMYRSILR